MLLFHVQTLFKHANGNDLACNIIKAMKIKKNEISLPLIPQDLSNVEGFQEVSLL